MEANNYTLLANFPLPEDAPVGNGAAPPCAVIMCMVLHTEEEEVEVVIAAEEEEEVVAELAASPQEYATTRIKCLFKSLICAAQLV